MRKLAPYILPIVFCADITMTVGTDVAQAQQVGPVNAILCNQKATLVGTTGAQKIVSGVAGQAISVCGWHITNTGTTGTFVFSSGTGTNCGTSTVVQIPTANIINSAPSGDHVEYASWSIPVGTDLCLTPSVAGISAVVWYSQQ